MDAFEAVADLLQEQFIAELPSAVPGTQFGVSLLIEDSRAGRLVGPQVTELFQIKDTTEKSNAIKDIILYFYF